jgi:type II secretory pathway pseudopilin PulG
LAVKGSWELWRLSLEEGTVLKKLMLLAALLAMLIVAAVPAIGQIDQAAEQEAESGEVNQDFSATSEGDNSSQCANIQGVANTGNAQNQLDLIQYGSTRTTSSSRRSAPRSRSTPTRTWTRSTAAPRRSTRPLRPAVKG